jgi:Putative adhesin
MKRIKNAGLLILSMVMVTARISAQTDAKEQLVVPLTEPGKPYKLNVNLVNGSIVVLGYEGKEIIIDAQTDPGKKGEGRETANGMKRITGGNAMDLTAEEKSNRVNVHSESSGKTIHLTIKIPREGSTLKLGTVNEGDIEVSNVNGEMEITNVNGAITLSKISGSVVANTVNGDLVVGFLSIDPKAPMAFSTLNGNVDVTFPAGLKANVKLKSDRGEMFTDFDVDVDKSQPKVNRTNTSGMYRLTVDDWVYGKINGGGPEMLMKNMNGNIYIRKAKQ